ncbi:hypothetical protein [Pinibacter aurantiacus]|uniref:Uncharacterized protein n=1 Tax=Pinibacter aurantiacus TaxID=2851599 RepID=A0A9E2SFU3_9BACT|nr:hypothetical protein [Pinibacter aurantiacus]MBV4359575.1 hypothetical protein [Pinibacter aurantiacus]
MKTIFTRVFVLLFLFPLFSKAQEIDSAFIKQRAAYFADSLDKAYQNKLWDQYVSLTQPGLIKFLGGKAGVIDYAERLWMVLNQDIGEKVSNQKVLQIVAKDNAWQCVVEKVKEVYYEDRKAWVTTYVVGKSEDEGNSWKFVEISEGMLINAREVMRDISDELIIPKRTVVYADDLKKQQDAEAAAAAAAAKKQQQQQAKKRVAKK